MPEPRVAFGGVPILGVRGVTWKPGDFIDDAHDLHALMTEVCDPTCRGVNLSSPWVDGPHAYASDGAIIVTQPAGNLHPDLRAALARMRGPNRPKDLPGEVQRLHPTQSRPVELPEADPTPPKCPECRGDGGRRLVIGGSGPSRCAGCLGTGRAPRSGETVEVAGWKLDSYYVGLLGKHNAVVYPPIAPAARLRGSPKFCFRFTAGPVVGWVLVAGAAAPFAVD